MRIREKSRFARMGTLLTGPVMPFMAAVRTGENPSHAWRRTLALDPEWKHTGTFRSWQMAHRGSQSALVDVGNVLQVPGGGRHDYAAVSQGYGSSDFKGCRLGGVNGHETLWNKPVAVSPPLVHEPVVVRLNAGEF